MMKKKILCAMMTVFMMGAMVLPVNAADVDYSTNVTYTEENDFTISIPASVTLNKNAVVSANINATKMNVDPETQVQVSIKSGIENGAVTLMRGNSNDTTTTSNVSLTEGGTGIGNNEVVAKFVDQNTTAESGTGTLYFSKLADTLKAGTWSGTIVFEIKATTRNNK